MKAKDFKALNDYVIVEPIQADAEIVGGLEMARSAKLFDRARQGRVLSAGPGFKGVECQVDPGVIVVYEPHDTSVYKLTINGEPREFQMVRHERLLGEIIPE